MADPYRYFRIEANELTEQLDRELLELEAAPDGDRVARLLRLAHTLKGAARIVKHTALAELAHALEDALAPLRGTGVGELAPAIAIARDIAVQVAGLTPAPAVPAPARAAPATPAAPSAPASVEPAAAALPRVDPGLLDHLIGELGELHAELAALRARRADLAELAELDAIDRGLASVRNSAEQLRLMPASTVLAALERTARDAAHGTGKTVRFSATGGDVRIDARVLTGLYGAMIQLVRNAVVHGLESPADRLAAGKPEAGHVAIAFRIHGERVVVQCDDDGRGIALGAVRDAAIARGVLAAGATPTEPELIALLLRGGVSTADGITPLAGRGIGLDLVSDAARGLGGDVTVRTTPGEGTSIALEVPCSVLSVPVLSVIAGERAVAIPQGAVRRVIALGPDALAAGSIDLGDGSRCKLIALARLLDAPVGEPRTAVVLDDGHARGALAIDRVTAIAQVVVRPFAASIPASSVIRGVALDAAGAPCPVIDPSHALAAVAPLRPEAGDTAPRPPPILVVDDSLTTRTLEQSMLEAAGYEVDVAASAELGLERAAARRYGLFLVDLEMPGLDGVGFIRELRRSSQTPAVLVTSRDTPEDRRRGADAGAQAYLIKGALDQRELLSLVERLLA